MDAASHNVRDLLVALSVAALGLAAIWYAYPMLLHHAGPDPLQLARDRREQLRAAAQAREAAATPAPTVTVTAPPGPAAACDFAPLLAGSGPDDGLFSPAAAMDIAQPAGPDPFLEVAREAAGHQRVRDAESAFIVACRLQSRQGQDPLRLAAIQGELARHYMAAARVAGPGAAKDALVDRARRLLDEALQASGAGPGAGAGQGRELRAALADLNDLAAGVPRKPAQVDAPAPQAPATLLVARDAELAQLDSDLQRLRAQAESVAADPAALRERAAAARAQRDACTDRACLLRWYARRRSELLAAF